ncbi:aminoglycoside phosphotransferase family protein [Gymnodinialimonas sp. 2305UL16-5]|uniref:aminoglycoside phosphotransferase family protein n=1 Tax=Gymnodinialimonas mytili TaxID=3126503 RepID=UPI00309EB42E
MLDDSPRVPDPALLRLWGLHQDGCVPVATTQAARIWKVTDAEGQPFALKTWKPGIPGASEAAAPRMLRAWNGRGAVRVVAEHGPSSLMDWLPGGSAGDLTRAGQDGDGVLAAALAALPRVDWIDVAPMPDLRTTCRALLSLRQRAVPKRRDQAALRQAQTLCRQLLDSPAPRRVLHGDLHHDNILNGPNGWRVIDPNPTIGDPAYEFGNVFRNPDGGPALCNPGLIKRRAALGARALSVPVARILAWGAVRTALSIAWSVQDRGQAPAEDLRILHALLRATPLPVRGQPPS